MRSRGRFHVGLCLLVFPAFSGPGEPVGAPLLLTGPMPEVLDFEPNVWGRLLVSGFEGEAGRGGPSGPSASTNERSPG